MRRTVLTIAFAIGFVILGGLAPLAGETSVTVLADGHGGALWLEGDGMHRLRLANGNPSYLTLPEGVAWNSLTSERATWRLAGTRKATELVLIEGEAERFRVLEGPDGIASMVEEPLLIASGSRGLGLAWLEGDGVRSKAVHFASKQGETWSPSLVVSPPGPGTQIALSATVLEDQRVLLLWSAFDGQDDEILWSAGRGGAFSSPLRLGPANSVPDITPAVTATGKDTALAAWSTYDGKIYQLVVSRFDGSTWSSPRQLSRTGELFPSFTVHGNRTYLQAQSPARERWMLTELSATGELLAWAEGPRDRPVLIASSSEEIELRVGTESAVKPMAWNR